MTRPVLTLTGSVAVWLLTCSATLLLAADAPAPIPAAEAPAHFKLPPGFQATLFAGEPDVVQPIALTFDDRGRVWVVENHSYPGWKGEGHDRVLIFDDRDGDGHFDERKVFLENGSNLSGIEWGHGGVWLCSTPNLVFVPDANQDDVPDGPAVAKLDGWDPTARHNVTSSLAWGPDGWLFGCNGILSNSRVGRPGTPDAERTAMNCGVWRYHPVREAFEVVAHGTTNPWGLDFDQYGQTFITNCVIEHLWHAVPGARFERMFGQDFNRRTYEQMRTCADHIHWAGGPWTEARGGERHSSHGGGHAHVGAMIYLGDNWPEEYRNHLFTCNIHGNRVNQDSLERQASGYVAHHAADFLHAGDPWFRGMLIKYGPDGASYVTDWTDTGECHNYEVADRTNGRIYKVSYGQPKRFSSDLGKLADAQLLQHLHHANEWVSRHARRILQERHTLGKLDTTTRTGLLAQLDGRQDVIAQLRTLWALHLIGATDDALLTRLFDSPHDVARGWAVQLALEGQLASPAMLARLAKLAHDDPSSWVRLALAAGLQRLPVESREPIAKGLIAHSEDAADRNLSLMVWYGIEPLTTSDPQRALALAAQSSIPRVTQFIARALAEPADTKTLVALVAAVAKADDAHRESLLAGLHEALAGRRRVAQPDGWSSTYAELARSKASAIRQRAILLALIFGDEGVAKQLRSLAANRQAELATRQTAIAALTQARTADLAPLLRLLLTDAEVRIDALRGLAAVGDDGTVADILRHYSEFDAAARQEAIGVLTARKASAIALLDAVDRGQVSRGDVSAFHVQQLDSLADKDVTAQLARHWGAARPTAADRLALISQFKSKLTPAVVAQADTRHGRAVFARTCATCHKLFDTGGAIGPELTGSQRDNLDYVLSNVLDPSAVVARDYQMNVIQTADGRVLAGIVKREDDNALTVQTATEAVVVPKGEIEARRATPNSMMPEGLLLSLSEAEIRDLVAYLGSPAQVEAKP